MATWNTTAVFYHIYPIGLLGAPRENIVSEPITSTLPGLAGWTDHIRAIGCNAVYLGPVFQSSTHGYDTIDYRTVDRRLGTNEDLRALVDHWHQHDIRVVLDAVLNHVSRDFPQFVDLRERGKESPYVDWFADIMFGEGSPFGDSFTYAGWSGNLELVKLNLHNREVRDFLFDVVRGWFREFGIDGLRLDAADVMDKDFLRELAVVCRETNVDCWLMGEVVHGNYAEWAGPGMLDSVTNYEAFKGLYSSLNDHNLFEIAHSLNREFGCEGVYRHLQLYNFVDNHDVNRVASLLKNDDDLPLLYAMLFTMPGIPSIYYGSEWGAEGAKRGGNDGPMRPAYAWPVAEETMPHPELQEWIARLAAIRLASEALLGAGYRELHVGSEQFAYLRSGDSESAVVAVNCSDTSVAFAVTAPLADGTVLVDRLSPHEQFTVRGDTLDLGELGGKRVRILSPM